MSQTIPIDFNLIRKTFANLIKAQTGIQAILSEPETQNQPRPPLPYFTFKLTGPATKSGDDSKENVLDIHGNPTTVWNSGGVRKLTVSFQTYGNSHEEAYNYMTMWQGILDLEDVQETLREQAGIAVWVIGNVADLSQLLNTGYEGRANMDCTFGIASNMQSDLGAIEHVEIDGAIDIAVGGPTVDTEIEVDT